MFAEIKGMEILNMSILYMTRPYKFSLLTIMLLLQVLHGIKQSFASSLTRDKSTIVRDN